VHFPRGGSFERSVVEKKEKDNFTQAGPSLVTCDSDLSPFAKLFQATVAETFLKKNIWSLELRRS
jgi:hypothetical protein